MPHRRRPVLSDEDRAEIDRINQAIKGAAEKFRALSAERTLLYRQLRDQGWKVKHLAELAGITPQRMSKILDPEVTPRGAARRTARAVKVKDPWDGWV